MTDIPFFLQECHNLPDHIENSQEPPRIRRAFQLVVSLHILLETTPNAAERLFRFVSTKNHEGEITIVIWLSSKIYLIDQHTDRRQAFFKIKVNSSIVYICRRMPSTVTVGVLGVLGVYAIGGVMDALLLLMANDKNIYDIQIFQSRTGASIQSFPASVPALNLFVSRAKSDRKLLLDDAGLSVAQWQVVTWNCNNNVELYFGLNRTQDGEKLRALIDAMKHSMGPAKLFLHPFMGMYQYPDFFDALGFLKKLTIRTLRRDNVRFMMLCEALARNNVLQYLKFIDGVGITLSDAAQWEQLCITLASHPSLKTLIFQGVWRVSTRSEERDELFVQHILRNNVLCKLDVECLMYDWQHVQRAVQPHLKLNRFRPVVEAIKHETNVTRRLSLFTTTLVRSKKVLKNPSYCFLLLKKNMDFLLSDGIIGVHGEKRKSSCETSSSLA